jgi:hypothetical protein
MSCIKTGCSLFLEPYGLWAYGDAHMDTYEEVYIFRICELKRVTNSVRHFTVRDWDYFFDEELVAKGRNATLIAPNIHVTNHGYDGIEDPFIVAHDRAEYEKDKRT